MGAKNNEDSAMTDVVADGISAKMLTASIQDMASHILFKVRYLKRDVQTVNRAAQLMEKVSMLDKFFRVNTGKMQGIWRDLADLTDRRRRMDGMVRVSMEYDESKHSIPTQFDAFVENEAERRLIAIGVEGTSLVTALVSTLKTKFVAEPEDTPTERND